MDSETARRQYALGVLNRRIARRVDALDSAFHALTGTRGRVTLLCEEGCSELVAVPLSVYERVGEHPHRFVVARGHAQAVDDVVRHLGDVDVVEIKPQFRR